MLSLQHTASIPAIMLFRMLSADPAAVLNILKATPRRIAAASKSLSNAQLNLKPAPDSWSANDVLAHLRACGDVWGKGIRLMLTQDRPTFTYVSPRTWIRKTNYPDQEFAASFAEFKTQRNDLLRLLEKLTPEDWLRGASVKAASQRRDETVLSYAQRMAQHEAGHCDQIDRILGRG